MLLDVNMMGWPKIPLALQIASTSGSLGHEPSNGSAFWMEFL